MNKIALGPELAEHINLNGNATEYELQDALRRNELLEEINAELRVQIMLLKYRHISLEIIAFLMWVALMTVLIASSAGWI